ncbi:MAG: M4 family metallopeptidase [Anaerolineaceae bacterium]|nr:M4 family metallopeptidase [Anaerolineaceae bacterium]
MLEQIAQNGTPEQRALAAQNLAATTILSDQRQAVAKGEVPSGAKAMSAGPGKNRFVYTADNNTSLPGRILRQEGQPASGDTAADEAFDGAGSTYDLYKNTYQRDSIDGSGLALISTVHYSRSYDNAFWNGHQMVYGDGDEDLPVDKRMFNRFTIAIDVIGHELTHGVTQYEANLNYSGQSGALNESMSDVFGSLVKQYSLNQGARAAEWIIGAGLFTSNVNGVGIRSMKAPGTAYDDPVIGKDPQPGHMRDYVNTTQDNGGVHINSGIPNHAFYVAAYELNGNAWEKAGKIWYATLTDRLTSTSTFQDAASLTFAAAGDLFGVNSLEQMAVKKGWSEVGIEVGGVTPPDNPGCLSSLTSLIKLFRP